MGWMALPPVPHDCRTEDEKDAMTIHTLGVDIARNVLKRRVMRDSLMLVIAEIGPCTITIE